MLELGELGDGEQIGYWLKSSRSRSGMEPPGSVVASATLGRYLSGIKIEGWTRIQITLRDSMVSFQQQLDIINSLKERLALRTKGTGLADQLLLCTVPIAIAIAHNS